jgi:hypothetical protein
MDIASTARRASVRSHQAFQLLRLVQFQAVANFILQAMSVHGRRKLAFRDVDRPFRNVYHQVRKAAAAKPSLQISRSVKQAPNEIGDGIWPVWRWGIRHNYSLLFSMAARWRRRG